MALFGLEGPWEVFAFFSWPLVRVVSKVFKLSKGVSGHISQVAYSYTHTVLPTEGLSFSLETWPSCLLIFLNLRQFFLIILIFSSVHNYKEFLDVKRKTKQTHLPVLLL